MKLRYVWMQNVSFQSEKEARYLDYILARCGSIEKFQEIRDTAYKKGNYLCEEYRTAINIDNAARRYAKINPTERLYVQIY